MATSDTNPQEATRGQEEIIVAVIGWQPWDLEQLLRWATRVHRPMLRMARKGTDSGPAVDHQVNLARRAG